MILDAVKIGMRIRKIREEIYHESRQLFAERCGLSENHLGKLETGTLNVSVKALNKIFTQLAQLQIIFYMEIVKQKIWLQEKR